MKAFFDSFAGLVPCEIVGLTRDNEYCFYEATVKVTADHGAYKRGQTVDTLLSRVVPRNAIRRLKYSTRIKPYSWHDRGLFEKFPIGTYRVNADGSSTRVAD